MTFFPFFFIGVWVVTGAAIVSSTIVEVVVGIDSVVFVGDDFFFLLPFTRVHPSSFLGCTSLSVFVFVFSLASVVVVVVVFTLVFVVSLAVVVVLLVGMVAF